MTDFTPLFKAEQHRFVYILTKKCQKFKTFKKQIRFDDRANVNTTLMDGDALGSLLIPQVTYWKSLQPSYIQMKKKLKSQFSFTLMLHIFIG